MNILKIYLIMNLEERRRRRRKSLEDEIEKNAKGK